MTEKFFDVLEGVTAEETTKEQRVNDNLSEAQKHIGFGTKVFLLTPSVVQQPLVVGHILPPNEWPVLRNLAAMPMMVQEPNELPGTDEEEHALFAQGYRRGMFYSEDHPLGYVQKYHQSRLYPITESEFVSVRTVDQRIEGLIRESWFHQMEQDIISAIEKLPNAPYRKLCPKCASGRVVVAEYFEGVRKFPIALQPTPDATALTVRTGEAISLETLATKQRCFYCADCKWESEPLDETEYPEVHACSHDVSQLEALFRLEDYVL